MARRITWLDVFTDRPMAGNQLCVVHDADGLDDDAMQAIARETMLSETTFVHPPTVDGADYCNRIFSPPFEMPFAGHPSLGTAVAVALVRDETDVTYVQQTHAGLQPVTVHRSGTLARASMLQAPTEFGPCPERAEVADALGLAPAALHVGLAPQVVSTGARHLMVVLAGALPEALDVDGAKLDRLLERLEAIVAYVVTVSDAEGAVQARSFFVDRGSLVEDPATGSAAGPLVALLARHGLADAITITQGVAMGRPSRIEADLVDGLARVSGDVVVVATGTTVACT